jgi:tetratricopeptide (TPR) repeat protein
VPRSPRSRASAPALNALGDALEALDRLDEAIEAYRSASEATPRIPARAARRSACAVAAGPRTPLERSIGVLRRSLALDPANADAWNDLGNALANVARHASARAAYREGLRVQPGYHQVESNLLIGLHYDAALDAQAIFDAHRDWARRHAAGSSHSRFRLVRPRLGFESACCRPTFTPGPTASFLLPLAATSIARASSSSPTTGPAEGVEPRLASAIGHWRHVAALDDAALALRIADDSIDVLVDLAGHTPGGRLLALARRPARAVVEWLDYFDTTGLDAVDVIVGDPVSTPPDRPNASPKRVALIDPAASASRRPPAAPESHRRPRSRRAPSPSAASTASRRCPRRSWRCGPGH